MRTQEFNSKLISLLPLDEVPLHVPLRRPRPLRFERLRVGGEGKADANLTNFLSTCCAWRSEERRVGKEATHPAPSARKYVIRLHSTLPSAPLRAPSRIETRKSSSLPAHNRLRGATVTLVHASPPPLCSPSRTASPPAPLAIRKAPSGRRRKSRRQSHKFFKHLLRLAPQLAATPWGGSPPRPLRQKICYSDCTENCPLRPLRAPRRFGIRKSASNSGHSPLRGSGGCSMHCSMHCSTHCRPSLFAAHRR